MEFGRSACGAAAAGDIVRLRALLVRRPGEAAAADLTGYTPLHYAARAGREDAVALLLGAGADARSVTAAGRATPLHRAAYVGSVPVIRLL